MGNLQGPRVPVRNMDAWLASNSARRLTLLAPLFSSLHHKGLDDVDETPPSGTVEHQVLTICQRKAQALPKTTHDVVIVSDTMLSDPDDHSLSWANHETSLTLLSCCTGSAADFIRCGPPLGYVGTERGITGANPRWCPFPT